MIKLSCLIDQSLFAYASTTLILICCYLVKQSTRPKIIGFLKTSHFLLLLISSLFIISTLIEICTSYFSHEQYAKYAWLNRAFDHYWYTYWILVLFKGLLPVFLYFNFDGKIIRVSAFLAFSILLCFILLQVGPTNGSWNFEVNTFNGAVNLLIDAIMFFLLLIATHKFRHFRNSILRK